MELKKMREMTAVELNTELANMKKELFNLRFQHVTGQLENPVKLRETKRDIARVKTVIREKELAKVQGLLVGTSSGANVWAAKQMAAKYGKDLVIATVLADRVERYFSTSLI